jgi:chromosome segregation ATPase
MAIEEKLEDKIHRTERKLLELSLHAQRLNLEYQQLLGEWALTSEQLKEFTENPVNFSSAIWDQLQKEKKELEEKLNLQLNNVRNANKTQDILSEQGRIQQHWLFVR